MGSILQDMVKKAPAFAKDRQGIDAIASGFIMGALMGGGRIGINKVAGAIAGDLKYEIDPTKITESSKFKKLGKYLFDSTANTEQRLTQQVERIKDSIKRNPNQFDNAVKENIANLSKEFNYIENNLRRKFDSKIVDLNEQLSNPDITQEQKKELESQIELLNTNKESALQSIIENEEVSSLLGETNNLEYLTEVKKQLDTLNTTYNKADDGKITFNTDIIDTLLETSLAKESSNMMAQFLDAGLKLDSFLRDANTNEESRNNLKLNSLSVLTSLKANYIDFLHTNGLDATTPFRIEGLAMLNEEGKKQMGLPDDLSIETINNNLTEFLDVYSTHHNTALNDAKNKKVTFPDSYNEGVYNEAGELTYEGVLAEGESITYEDENGKSITVTGEKGGNTPKPKVSKVYTKDTGQAAAVEAFVKKEYARAIARNVLLMNFYSDSLEELQSMFGENHAYLDLEVFKYATAKQLPATRVEIETLQSELDILKEGNSSEKLIKERIKYIEDKIKLLNEIVDKFEKDKVKGQFRYRGDNIATDLNKLVFELMLLEHNFNYKNSEFKIDYKGIKVFEKELLGDINDIIKLIQTKEELFAVYKAMLNKNDLTDFYKFIMAKRQEEAIARYMATEQYQKRLEFESLFESMGMSLPKDDKIEKLKTKLEDDPFSEIRLDILATEEATSADTTSPASNVPGTPDAPEEKTNEEVEDKTEINQEAIDEVKEALKDFKKYEIFEEDFIKDSNESIILSDNKITEFSEILTEDGDSILLFNDKDHQYYTLERENGKLIVKKDIISRSKFENDAKGKEDTPVNSIATNIGNELDTLNRIIYGNNNPIDTKNETALNEEVERIKNEAGAINPKYTNSFIQTLIELKEQFREENNVYEFITDPLIFKDKYKLKDNLSIGFSPDLLVITNDGKLIVHEFKSSKNSYESNKNSYQSQLLVYQAIINDLLSQNVNTNGENSKVVFVNTSGNFNTQDAGVREIPSNLNAKAHLNKLKQDYNNNISKENEEVLSLFEDGSFEMLLNNKKDLFTISDNDKIFNKLDKAGKKKVLEAIQDLISDNNKFQLKSFINSDGLETILILKDGFYHDIANQKRYSEESLKEFSLIDYNLQKDNLNKVIEKMLEDLDKDVDVNFTTEKTTNSETGLEDYSSFAKDGKSYIYLNSVILSLPEIVNEESAHTIQDTEVASILDLDFITMEDFAALLNNTSNDKDNFKIENC
jgi:hypothetical protein